MKQDIIEWVNSCTICQQAKDTNQSHKFEPVNTTVRYPNQRVHIDICGPFLPTEEGYTSVLTTADAATRWTEFHIIPSSSIDTEVVARTLVN